MLRRFEMNALRQVFIGQSLTHWIPCGIGRRAEMIQQPEGVHHRSIDSHKQQGSGLTFCHDPVGDRSA